MLFAALISSLALGASAFTSSSVSCPATNVLSCHNTTAQANTCCFESPGGLILQTQFWDTSPSTGPSNSWTIHGLWPDNCDGTYGSYCDPARAYTNITSILQQYGKTELLSYMDTYWKNQGGTDESLWEHEWSKHGTCMSTFDPKCYPSYQPGEEVPDYFQRTVDTFKTLNTYEYLAQAGITPSASKTYSLSAINAALKTPRGVSAVVQCANGALDEVWYYFNVKGSVQTGTFVPAEPVGATSSCSGQIAYLPKSSGSSSTTTTTSGVNRRTVIGGSSTGGPSSSAAGSRTSMQSGVSTGFWRPTGASTGFPHPTGASTGFLHRRDAGTGFPDGSGASTGFPQPTGNGTVGWSMPTVPPPVTPTPTPVSTQPVAPMFRRFF